MEGADAPCQGIKENGIEKEEYEGNEIWHEGIPVKRGKMNRSPEGEGECREKDNEKQVIQQHGFSLFPGIEESREKKKKGRDWKP